MCSSGLRNPFAQGVHLDFCYVLGESSFSDDICYFDTFIYLNSDGVVNDHQAPAYSPENTGATYTDGICCRTSFAVVVGHPLFSVAISPILGVCLLNHQSIQVQQQSTMY